MVLFPKTFTLYQTTPGSYINGKWIAGTPNNTTFTADIQPLTSNEILSLNIGRKELGKVKIYTDNNLTVQVADKTGDVVVYQGKKYEVISLDKHSNDLISHNKYIAEFRGNV